MRGLYCFLSANPTIRDYCGLRKLPDRRTFDRRYKQFAPSAEAQLRSLGLTLLLEGVVAPKIVATDSSLIKADGPVWHQEQKKEGIIPAGLRNLDREAEWGHSHYHGWIYGYKVHGSCTASGSVHIFTDATVTKGNAADNMVYAQRIEFIPALTEDVLADTGFDDGKLFRSLEEKGKHLYVPIGASASTSPERLRWVARCQSEDGKRKYKLREVSIEPLFGYIKELFDLEQLHVKGLGNGATEILLAFYAYDLIVLFNYLEGFPLGAVKNLLDII